MVLYDAFDGITVDSAAAVNLTIGRSLDHMIYRAKRSYWECWLWLVAMVAYDYYRERYNLLLEYRCGFIFFQKLFMATTATTLTLSSTLASVSYYMFHMYSNCYNTDPQQHISICVILYVSYVQQLLQH